MLQKDTPLPERSVIFIIDDEFSGQTNQIIPVFQKYNAPNTLFIATNLVNNKGRSWALRLEKLFHHTHISVVFLPGWVANDVHSGYFPRESTILLFARDLRKTLHLKEALQAENIADELYVPLPQKAP